MFQLPGKQKFEIPKKRWSKAPDFVKYGNEGEGDGRAYVHPFSEGDDYPSVTRITGLETGNFHRYNTEQAVRWCVDNWYELGVAPELAVARGMAQGTVHRDERAWVGTQVHQYVQALREGSWEFPILETVEQEQIVENYQAWWGTYNAEALYTELTVVNDTYGYAGTLDQINEVTDPFTGEISVQLADLKTSKSVGYSGHLMQLGALANAEYGMRRVPKGTPNAVQYRLGKSDKEERYAVKVELPKFDSFGIIHARAEHPVNVLAYSRDVVDSYFEEFLQYLNIFRVRSERKKKGLIS